MNSGEPRTLTRGRSAFSCMTDMASPGAGVSVVMATCSDERHPPHDALDEDDRSFWVTTGLFPQEIVVKLGKASQVTKVRTLTANVKKFSLEYCDEDEPVGFKPAFEVELADKGASRLQTEVHQVNCRAKFLKFIIGSGWGDFASVHRISVF